jgi:hypothetical protein
VICPHSPFQIFENELIVFWCVTDRGVLTFAMLSNMIHFCFFCPQVWFILVIAVDVDSCSSFNRHGSSSFQICTFQCGVLKNPYCHFLWSRWNKDCYYPQVWVLFFLSEDHRWKLFLGLVNPHCQLVKFLLVFFWQSIKTEYVLPDEINS